MHHPHFPVKGQRSNSVIDEQRRVRSPLRPWARYQAGSNDSTCCVRQPARKRAAGVPLCSASQKRSELCAECPPAVMAQAGTGAPTAEFAPGDASIKTTPIEADYDIMWHQRLGKGSYGAVFRCTHKRSGDRRAVKVMEYSRNAKRARREAILQIRCHHPNVVALHDAYDNVHKGDPFTGSGVATRKVWLQCSGQRHSVRGCCFCCCFSCSCCPSSTVAFACSIIAAPGFHKRPALPRFAVWHVALIFLRSLQIFIVLELMSGGELFDRIRAKQRFTEHDASAIMKTLATAVHHMHSLGVAHRDLKPENILLKTPDAPDSDVKLADFGFARAGPLTTPLGAGFYTSPEMIKALLQRKSSGAVKLTPDEEFVYDTSSDCWTLGVILYILLVGYPPYRSRDHANVHKDPFLQGKILRGEYSFEKAHWSKVSAEAKVGEAPHRSPFRAMMLEPKSRAAVMPMFHLSCLCGCRAGGGGFPHGARPNSSHELRTTVEAPLDCRGRSLACSRADVAEDPWHVR